MFFCNPYKQTNNKKEGDDGDAMQLFQFLINHHNFPWIPSLDGSKSPDLNPAASFSNGSASTCESAEDFIPTNDAMFHGASSSDTSTIFRQRRILQPTNTNASGKIMERFQKTRFRRFATRMMILLLVTLLLGVVVLLGLGQHSHYDSNAWNIPVPIKETTIWIRSNAIRIWTDGTVPSTSKVMEIMGAIVGIIGKIPWALSSLFQWDEVDDAIIHWTKRAIVMAPKIILRIGSEIVTFIYSATTTTNNIPSTRTVTTNFSRLFLQTIDGFTAGSEKAVGGGAQQALALLDFLQDTDL